MKSLFCCPLCGAPLDREEQRWSCPNRHSFDRAAAGYVHLLPANKKHSQDPGDDKAMVAARSAFLEKGWYAPLRGALCQAVAEYAVNFPDPVLVDSGCGEGYYTAGLFQALSAAELSPQIAGVDLSKAALRRAAKRLPEGEFAVPSARHLWEMKEVLYSNPYENPVKREDYPGFLWRNVRKIRYTVDFDSSADIMALFGMTPYAWKTPREGVRRLESLDRLSCQIGFDLHLYQKI